MQLFILEHPAFIPHVISRIQSDNLCPKQYTVYSTHPEVLKHLKNNGIPILNSPSLTEDEEAYIDQHGTELGNVFSEIPYVARRTRYKGVNVASLFAHGMDYYWIWVLKQALLTSKVIQGNHLSKVILGLGPDTIGPFNAPKERHEGKIAKWLCEQENIPVESMHIKDGFVEGFHGLKYSDEGRLRRILNAILSVMSWVMIKKNPKKSFVVMSASPRSANTLFNHVNTRKDWLYLTERAMPKYAWKLLRRGVPTIVVGRGRADEERVRAWKKRFLEIEAIASNDPFFTVFNIPLFSIVKGRYQDLFERMIVSQCGVIDELFKLFKNLSIDSLVQDDDVSSFHKTVASIANYKVIQTLVLMHGSAGQPRGYVPMVSNCIAVWGESAKQTLIDWGVSKEKIAVTGCPYFDALPERGKSSKGNSESVIKKLKIPKNRRVIFYAANRLRDEHHGLLRIKMHRDDGLKQLSAVVEAASRIKNAMLIIKIHQGDDIRQFESFIRTLSFRKGLAIQIVQDIPSGDILTISDVVVSYFSTVSIEAIAMDIPTINIELFPKNESIPFVSCRAAYKATNADSLYHSFIECIEKPDARKEERARFTENYCHRMDGQSTKRVLEWIDSEAKKKIAMQKVGVVIQARMSSHRLPGKVLAKIGTKTVMEHLVSRLSVIFPKSRIVLATSTNKEDDELVDHVKQLGIQIYRGSLENVLDRFYQASSTYNLDPIVRVTGDNPFLEPNYLVDLLRFYQTCGADYVSAKDPSLFPRGTTAEILSMSSLKLAHEKGESNLDREHVTWFIRQHPDLFNLADMPDRKEWRANNIRLALDEEDDLKLLRTIQESLGYDNDFGLDEIMNLYEKTPEIFKANQHVLAKN